MTASFPRITLRAGCIEFLCIVGDRYMECMVDGEGMSPNTISMDGWIQDDKLGIRDMLYAYLRHALANNTRKGETSITR